MFMTRKERLWASLKGEKVDRTPVSFYEINGYDENPEDKDPFNIYTDASWKEMIDMTREKTDRIVMKSVNFLDANDPIDKLTQTKTYYDENGNLHTITEINAKGRILRQHSRRDLDINTVWTMEHFIKDEEDLIAYLNLPHEVNIGKADITNYIQAEESITDTGIVLVDTGDALLSAATLFSMEEFTVTALTRPDLFTELLDIFQQKLLARTKITSQLLPNRLWRIYGPEYATPPYLPPHLYMDYVVEYDKDLIKIIKDNGGVARIHQHGNSKAVLQMTLQTGCDGIDPVEPSPQGDITLKEARKICGDNFVLFGNLEINDIELCTADEIEEKVKIALSEGPDSNGSSFVLMPSASPYGRYLSPKTVDNYKRILEIVHKI